MTIFEGYNILITIFSVLAVIFIIACLTEDDADKPSLFFIACILTPFIVLAIFALVGLYSFIKEIL